MAANKIGVRSPGALFLAQGGGSTSKNHLPLEHAPSRKLRAIVAVMSTAAEPVPTPDVTARVAIVTSFRHLPMRVRLATPLDDDELFELCAANQDLRIERSADGELTIMPPTGGETGRLIFELIGEFAAWVTKDGTGVGSPTS